jgi:hypothetical protein
MTARTPQVCGRAVRYSQLALPEPNNAMAAVLKIAEDSWIGTSPAITTKTCSCR